MNKRCNNLSLLHCTKLKPLGEGSNPNKLLRLSTIVPWWFPITYILWTTTWVRNKYSIHFYCCVEKGLHKLPNNLPSFSFCKGEFEQLHVKHLKGFKNRFQFKWREFEKNNIVTWLNVGVLRGHIRVCNKEHLENVSKFDWCDTYS